MTEIGIPEGWTYEGPDPSVGIFGELWAHEGCDWPDDEPPEVTEDEIYESEADGIHGGTVTITTLLTCTGCGVQAEVYSYDYEPGPDD